MLILFSVNIYTNSELFFSFQVFLTLTVAAGCLAAPRNIFNYNTDSLTGTQSGTPGRAVSGGYSWTAPNGQQVSINYIADGQGYRIVNSQNMFPAKQSLQQRSQPSHSVFVQTPKPTTQAPKAAVHSHFSVGTAFGSPSAPKYSWPQAAPKAAVPAPSKPTVSNHWAMSHFQLGSQSRPTTTARATQRFTTARPTTTTTPSQGKSQTCDSHLLQSHSQASTQPFCSSSNQAESVPSQSENFLYQNHLTECNFPLQSDFNFNRFRN